MWELSADFSVLEVATGNWTEFNLSQLMDFPGLNIVRNIWDNVSYKQLNKIELFLATLMQNSFLLYRHMHVNGRHIQQDDCHRRLVIESRQTLRWRETSLLSPPKYSLVVPTPN